MCRIGLLVSLIAGMAIGALPQASSAVAISMSTDGQVKVTIGTFFFAQGQKLALEVVRADPCPCLCDELLVTGFRILDAEGIVVYADETVPYPAPAVEWIGRWGLVRGDGEAVPAGKYTALVTASVGEFRGELQVVAPGAAGGLQASAKASVCGIGLVLYRLVEEGDEAATVTLRGGERLLIALPGNPTTGYAWEVVEEPAFLARVEGLDYLPDSTLLGGGGTFFFRYEATEAGEGELSFAYRRPWEALPPEQTFSVTIAVQ